MGISRTSLQTQLRTRGGGNKDKIDTPQIQNAMNRLISKRDKVDTHTDPHSHENFLGNREDHRHFVRDNWTWWLPGSGGEFAGCRVCESSMSRLFPNTCGGKRQKRLSGDFCGQCQDSGEAGGQDVLAGTHPCGGWSGVRLSRGRSDCAAAAGSDVLRVCGSLRAQPVKLQNLSGATEHVWSLTVALLRQTNCDRMDR